jgi:hypothetical protein
VSAQPARSPLHLVQERPPGPGLTDFGLWLRANGCNERTISSRFYVLTEFARDVPSFPNVSPMHVTGWLGRPGYSQWTRCA